MALAYMRGVDPFMSLAMGLDGLVNPCLGITGGEHVDNNLTGYGSITPPYIGLTPQNHSPHTPPFGGW